MLSSPRARLVRWREVFCAEREGEVGVREAMAERKLNAGG